MRRLTLVICCAAAPDEATRNSSAGAVRVDFEKTIVPPATCGLPTDPPADTSFGLPPPNGTSYRLSAPALVAVNRIVAPSGDST